MSEATHYIRPTGYTQTTRLYPKSLPCRVLRMYTSSRGIKRASVFVFTENGGYKRNIDAHRLEAINKE